MGDNEIYTCMFGGKIHYLRWKEVCMDCVEIIKVWDNGDCGVVVMWRPRDPNHPRYCPNCGEQVK